MTRKLLFTVIFCLIPFSNLHSSEVIKGKACYRFSDNESLTVARDIALSMAKRDALEGYAIFVETSSKVENFTLRNDLISSVSTGLLRRVKIIGRSENLRKREVCRKISAVVEPTEFKEMVIATINEIRRGKKYDTTGLLESEYLKIVRIEIVFNPDALDLPRIKIDEDMSSDEIEQEKKFYANCSLIGCRIIIATCKKYRLRKLGMSMTWYDDKGNKHSIFNRFNECHQKGDILKYYLPIPPFNFTDKINFIH